MIVYWYPKCSTCKRAKKFLDDRNCTYELIDIKEKNPSYEDLEKLISDYSIPIRKLFNTSGLVYKELGLKEKLDSYSLKEQIQLLASNGMLVKRPICILEDEVFIGFKEKEWKERFGDEMHDKMNDEESKKNVTEEINTYFDLSSLSLEDLDKELSELTFDSEK